MKKPLSQEELEEQLCKYCPLTDYGLTEINNAPYNLCEGISCDKAYENYLDDFEEENKEMDNLEKVRGIEIAATRVKNARSRINSLKKVIASSSGYKTEYRVRNVQSEVTISADDDITALILELEEKRLKIAEDELDQLLNGDVKRLKACLEGLGSEQ